MTVYRRIKIRRGTFLEWQQSNSTLHQGELGLDLTNKRIKAGDGFTSWNDLDYIDEAAMEILRTEYGNEISFEVGLNLTIGN